MNTQAPQKTFDVVCEYEALNVEKMRNEINIAIVEPFQEKFELATDEGTFHGGRGSAPVPLAYFAAGLAGCFMTQVRAFARRLKVDVGEIRVTGRCHWRAEQVGNEPYVTAPISFELDVDLDSSSSLEEQMELVEAAKKGCFVEQTLAATSPVSHRLRTETDWMTV